MTLLSEVQNSQIQELRDRVAVLEEQVAALLEASTVAVINLRDISREQAKAEIVELFDQTETPLYYDDIMDRLCIDLELVVDICRELLEEGAIGVDDNAV